MKRKTHEDFGRSYFAGHRHRMDLYLVMARYSIKPPESFYVGRIQQQMQETTGEEVPDATMWREVNAIESQLMIERLPEREGPHVSFVRINPEMWAGTLAVIAAAEKLFPPRTS